MDVHSRFAHRHGELDTVAEEAAVAAADFLYPDVVGGHGCETGEGDIGTGDIDIGVVAG